MFTSLICFTVFLSIVSGWQLPFSSSPGNYSLLCDPTKQYRCNCPVDDTASVVNCSARRLDDLPNDIKFPAHITEVSFAHNQLTNVPSTVFTEGLKVEILDLSYNHIDILASDAFASLNDLQTLDLSHNQIWSLSVDTFGGLNNLDKLNLAFNKLNDIMSDTFKPCSKLRELSLRYNSISFVTKTTFSELPELQVLDMTSCGLSFLPEEVFQKNIKLDELKLTANNFPSVPTKGLKSAKSLTHLDLSENPIESLRAKDFEGLTNLRVLTITHMRNLVSVEQHSLTGLENLRSLLMTDNLKLVKISESAFKKMPPVKSDDSSKESSDTDEDEDKKDKLPSLEKLILRHNGLKSLPEGLLDWSQVKELDLRENPWQCDCHFSWIAKNEVPSSAKNDAKCTSPSRVAGKSLASLAESDYTCSYLTSEATIALSILVVAAFVLALFGIAYVMYRRSLISCRRKNTEPRYARVVSNREKVDLEWDHAGEPESRA